MEQPTFYIIWNPAGALPPSYRHPTIGSAQREAERLARLHKGQSFIVMQAVGECKANDVNWSRYESDRQVNADEIPF